MGNTSYPVAHGNTCLHGRVVKSAVFSLIALALGASDAWAKPIPEQTAKQLAVQRLQGTTRPLRQIGPARVTVETEGAEPVIYVVNFESAGWALVSADDAVVEPVIAWSPNGQYPGGSRPPAVEWMIEHYRKAILTAKRGDVRRIRPSSLGSSTVRDSSGQGSVEEPEVEPLLKTTWNQDWPYNAACPADAAGPGGHCVPGCVPVAMAQILRYWESPTVGIGAHSYNHPVYGTLSADFAATHYNYTNMPAAVSGLVPNDDVSQLIYHCGVACDTEFSPTSTPTWANRVMSAFANHFGYYSDTDRVMQDWCCTAEEWFERLKVDLFARRPIFYMGGSNGVARGPHAFVVDGYQRTNYFHVNWGWGGLYDGYYNLGSIKPGLDDDFTLEQQAVFGLRPQAMAGQPVIASDTTWSGTVVVQSNIKVLDNATLTIEPGTTVEFKGWYELAVAGTLRAVGTAEKPILFHPASPEIRWKHLIVDDGSGYGGAGGTMKDNPETLIRHCVFTGGTATNSGAFDYSFNGGAIFIRDFSKVEVTDCVFSNNYAVSMGGAIGLLNSSALISNNLACANQSTHGAIGVIGGNPLVVSNRICLNTTLTPKGFFSQDGGGVWLSGETAGIVRGNTIVSNIASSAAGILCEARAARIEGNYIAFNHADVGGAGIGVFLADALKVDVIGNTIEGNTLTDASPNPSAGNGAGLYYGASSGLIVNNLIVNNVGKRGAGITIDNPSWPNTQPTVPIVANNTIVGNHAHESGGGIEIYKNTAPIIVNCILWGNTAGQARKPNQLWLSKEGLVDVWNNPYPWADSWSRSTFRTCCLEGGTNAISTASPTNLVLTTFDTILDRDPRFAYAGPAPYRLLADSPYIDAGTTDLDLVRQMATDIQGNGRIVRDFIDLGAYESPHLFEPMADQLVSEGENLVVQTMAPAGSGLGPPATFSLGIDAPVGMTIDPGSGELRWIPAHDQCPRTNVVTVLVCDSSLPPLQDAVTFTVRTRSVKTPPVMAPLLDQTIPELATLSITNRVTDHESMDIFTFDLLAGPEGLVLNSATGVLTWTPSEFQGPSTNTVTVRVTDSGTPPLSDTNSFSVTVSEVNQPPVLVCPTDLTVLELTSLTVTNLATDLDIPANTLMFALVSAPDGVVLDPSTGVLNWTPTEWQGPSTNDIVLRLTDDGLPALSATNHFTVVVQEVNRPPVLVVPPDQVMHAGAILILTNAASDSDWPPNELDFSLKSGPAGIELDPVTGILTWRTQAFQESSTNLIIISLTDGSALAVNEQHLSITDSFTVVVQKLFISAACSDGQLTFQFCTIAGRRYRLERRDDLGAGSWEPVGGQGQVLGTGELQTISLPVGSDVSRFYRVAALAD